VGVRRAAAAEVGAGRVPPPGTMARREPPSGSMRLRMREPPSGSISMAGLGAWPPSGSMRIWEPPSGTVRVARGGRSPAIPPSSIMGRGAIPWGGRGGGGVIPGGGRVPIPCGGRGGGVVIPGGRGGAEAPQVVADAVGFGPERRPSRTDPRKHRVGPVEFKERT